MVAVTYNFVGEKRKQHEVFRSAKHFYEFKRVEKRLGRKISTKPRPYIRRVPVSSVIEFML